MTPIPTTSATPTVSPSGSADRTLCRTRGAVPPAVRSPRRRGPRRRGVRGDAGRVRGSTRPGLTAHGCSTRRRRLGSDVSRSACDRAGRTVPQSRPTQDTATSADAVISTHRCRTPRTRGPRALARPGQPSATSQAKESTRASRWLGISRCSTVSNWLLPTRRPPERRRRRPRRHTVGNGGRSASAGKADSDQPANAATSGRFGRMRNATAPPRIPPIAPAARMIPHEVAPFSRAR
jgi:hypothetical protein